MVPRESSQVFGRRKGLLVNRSVRVEGGRRVFLCDCDCGRTEVKVDAYQFNNGRVLGCPKCKRQGLTPLPPPDQEPKRVSVSFDPTPFAQLGYDLSVEGNASGAVARSLLREFGLVVREVSRSLPFLPAEWEALREVVEREPELLDRSTTPSARVGLVCERAELIDPHLSAVRALATLAALRWVLDHSEAEGEWWVADNRTEGL